MQETRVRSLGREDPLEKEVATHSSILAWEIPWTEEPEGLHGVAKESDTTNRFHFSHIINTATAKNHTTLGELNISGEMRPSFSGCVI